MNSVFILTQDIYDEQGGEFNHILGVYPTKRDAQIELCQQIHMDAQFGGYENCQTVPEFKWEGFDLYDAYNTYQPLPVDSVHMWDGVKSSASRSLSYGITEFPIQSFSE